MGEGLIFGLMALCLVFVGTIFVLRIVRKTKRVFHGKSVQDFIFSVTIFSLAVICSFAAGLNVGGRNFENTLTQEEVATEQISVKSDDEIFLAARETLPNGELSREEFIERDTSPKK